MFWKLLLVLATSSVSVGEPMWVDRVEGDVAVLETKELETIDVPMSHLPVGVREGDRVGLVRMGGRNVALQRGRERLERLRASGGEAEGWPF